MSLQICLPTEPHDWDVFRTKILNSILGLELRKKLSIHTYINTHIQKHTYAHILQIVLLVTVQYPHLENIFLLGSSSQGEMAMVPICSMFPWLRCLLFFRQVWSIGQASLQLAIFQPPGCWDTGVAFPSFSMFIRFNLKNKKAHLIS